MKMLFSYQMFIRLLSALSLVIPLACGLLPGDKDRAFPELATAALYSASGVLLCVNVGKQSRRVSMACAVLGLLSSMTCALPGWSMSLIVVPVSLSIILSLSVEGWRKFFNPRMWFGEDAIWCTAQEYARLLFSVFFLFLGCITVMSAEAGGCLLWTTVVLSVVYIVLYYRAYTGYTVLIPRGNEKKIRDMNRLSARSRLSVEDENELTRLKVIYARSENVMREKKPFLDSDFCLEDLAVLTYCNRGQLSKAINTFSGMNFKSYLNRNRIDYALDLIEKDPRLKVSELSNMSGFCTSVSFTMAFKQNVNMLPSDYLREKMNERLNVR